MAQELDEVISNLSTITEELLGPFLSSGKVPSENLSRIYTIVQKVLMDLEELDLVVDRATDVNFDRRPDKYERPDLSSRGMKLVPGSYK